MPELPEVETIRRQLEAELKGARFLALETTHPKSLQPNLKKVRRGIVGKRIWAVGRRAKLLIFELEKGGFLLFHLKLTGRLLLRPAGFRTDDYARTVFHLENSRQQKLELRFADSRKFGFVKLVESATEMEKIRQKFGPEPLDDLTLAKFEKVLEKSGRAVKAVLLDQAKISGVGNIYANDSLWLARINPRQKAHEITPDKKKELYRAVLAVLQKGLKYGGASDQWYRQVHGEKGSYQKHFLVYGKQGEKCKRCGTKLQRIVVASRGTFFCPACQKLK